MLAITALNFLADAATQPTVTAPISLDKLALAIGMSGILLGVGITVQGAARGIGNIGGSAMEAIARQPEAKGSIGTNMIIAAALIEGFTFFGLVLAILAMIKF